MVGNRRGRRVEHVARVAAAICRVGADIPPVSHAAAGCANFYLLFIDVTSEVDVPAADPEGYTVALEENEDGVGASHAACMQYGGVPAVNEILENVLLGVFLRYALNDASLGVIGRNDVGGDLPFLLSVRVLRELTVARGVFGTRGANKKRVLLLV